MISTVILSNTQAAILYWLAFIGVWHIIGIPPVVEWQWIRRKNKR